MSCGVGCRLGSHPALLWLWHRPAAMALIRPLVWEPPYAMGAAQEKAKKKKKKKKKQKKKKKKKKKKTKKNSIIRGKLWHPKNQKQIVKRNRAPENEN